MQPCFEPGGSQLTRQCHSLRLATGGPSGPRVSMGWYHRRLIESACPQLRELHLVGRWQGTRLANEEGLR